MKHIKYLLVMFLSFTTIQAFAICETEYDHYRNAFTAAEYLDIESQAHFSIPNNRTLDQLQVQRNSLELVYRNFKNNAQKYAMRGNGNFSSVEKAIMSRYVLYLCHVDAQIKIQSTQNGSSPATQTQPSTPSQSNTNSQSQANNQTQPTPERQAQQREQEETNQLAASNKIIGSQKQSVQEFQQKADQARQGKRRRHEPENEASHCIQPDFGGLYGGMKNTCNFKVWYTYCGYRPSERSWLTGMNCEKQSFGSDSVMPGNTSAAHTKGVQQLYWIACKEPAWTVDTEFVAGGGIRARCYTVGGN